MSLPNLIIKASQYDGIHAQSVDPAELPRFHSNPVPPSSPAPTSEPAPKSDPVPTQAAAPAPAAEPQEDVRNRQQAIMKDAFQKAKSIVEAAQNYSLNQLQEATMRMNEECAQMKIRSYEDGYQSGFAEGKQEGTELGYQDGYQQGLKKAQEEFNQKNQSITENAEKEIRSMLDSIEQAKEDILKKFEEDLQGLSIGIAQKILRRELQLEPDSIRTIINNVLDSYRNQAWVKINVSPSDAEILTKADRSIIQELQKVSSNVKIVPDPDLKDGGCIIDLPDQVIDAGVDTQMEQIQKALNL